MAKYASVATGTFLYHQGDHCEKIALVGAGDMRVFKTRVTGHEITLYHVQDGQACLVNMLTPRSFSSRKIPPVLWCSLTLPSADVIAIHEQKWAYLSQNVQGPT